MPELNAKTTSKESSKKDVYYATGRRKTSSARVFLKPGTGLIKINDRTLEQYFGRRTARIKVMLPLKLSGVQRVDLLITVVGGGNTGQSDAIAHGISRALLKYDETIRPVLKAAGLLTRDPRKVERKKYGFKKARKKSQYSKR